MFCELCVNEQCAYHSNRIEGNCRYFTPDNMRDECVEFESNIATDED